ncbi:Crp/Fnr family transcriptional regulator [Desulfocastanea catecholica]
MLWLKHDYQEDIARIAVKERLPKGVILDPACIYYLQQGLCVLNHLTDDGEEKSIVYFQEKSLMGFMPFLLESLVDDNDETEGEFLSDEYLIKTRSVCDVLKADGDRFFFMLEESPRLYRTVICTLSQNYLNTIELLSQIINKSAPVRICRIILEFRRRQERRLVLLPHLTYYDIGIFTALHIITVTKIFKALFTAQILSKVGRLIVIEQEDMLIDIAKGKFELDYL